MKRELEGSLYYLFSNLRFSLLSFWGILVGILALSIVSAMLIEDSYISFNLAFPMYAFAGVFGFWIVKNAIPYLIKMGATRKVIFISIGIFGVVLSILNAVVSNSVIKIVSFFFKSNELNTGFTLTVDQEEEFITHIGQLLSNDGFLTRIVIDSSISFFVFGVLFIGGLIFYKYGVVGGITSFVAVFIAFIYAGNAGWLESFVMYLIDHFSYLFFYQLFAVGVIVYLLSYLLLNRLTLR